jgi:hypothetical protein
MQLALGLSLAGNGALQALADARFTAYLTDADGARILFSNGLPVRLARPVGATLLRNSRGQVITNSPSAAIHTV